MQITPEKLMEREKHFKSNVSPSSLIPVAASDSRSNDLMYSAISGEGIESREQALHKDDAGVFIETKTSTIAISDKEAWVACDYNLQVRKLAAKDVIAY